MKKAKLVFWLLVLGFVALVIFQNRTFFLAPQSLGINLYVAQYATPELPNAVFFVAFFLAGLLAAYLASLPERFRSGRMIKQMRQSLDSYQSTIDSLKADLESLKAMKAEPAPEPQPEPEPAQKEAEAASEQAPGSPPTT